MKLLVACVLLSCLAIALGNVHKPRGIPCTEHSDCPPHKHHCLLQWNTTKGGCVTEEFLVRLELRKEHLRTGVLGCSPFQVTQKATVVEGNVTALECVMVTTHPVEEVEEICVLSVTPQQPDAFQINTLFSAQSNRYPPND